jgi:cephalosporin-C deacetylase
MPAFDLPLEQLQTYSPEVPEPADFDQFWQRTLDEANAEELNVLAEPVTTDIVAIQTWDLTFSGFAGHPIRAWLHLPTHNPNELSAVVQYRGYGQGRGLPHENILWAAAGYAHLVIDTRGQGSSWQAGDTADPVGSGPAHPGFMTRGILDPDAYYYRRVFVDAVRAISVMTSHERVDPERVSIMGGSQGGGIALAVAALAPRIAAAMIDVPFLCNWPRGLEITTASPYGYAEIVHYLRVHRDHEEQALRTLSYFDGVNFARRAQARALFSVGLMDETCPPSTVYSAYNIYGGPKEISVYPYNDHEGGGAFHQSKQLRWLKDLLS